METSWEITDTAELAPIVETILTDYDQAPHNQAFVLALHGDLGAGKTTFVQVLAKTLGVEETVTSPTFVIQKSYQVGNRVAELIHIDAYRIEEIDEMRVLGFAAILEQKDTIICIEWAENISELLPANTKHLTFAQNGERRLLTYV